MKRYIKQLSAIVIFTMIFHSSCVTNAITGRSQLSLISDADLQAVALVQYKEFLSTNKIVPDANSNTAMVKRVGSRVAAAVKQYYASGNTSFSF